jgi:hypothetical protein
MTDALSITVNAAHIDAALCAVSKEETRHYLQGVFIDARGFIAATNGHIAFAARCPDAIKTADCRPAYSSDALPGIIVPHAALTQASKAAGKSKGLCMVFERDSAGLWWITYGNARVHFEPIDSTFPDWTRIIPEAPETETAAHYQPLYIAALGNMAKALRDNRKGDATAFHLHQSGPNPALVTFPRKADKAEDVGPRADCCAVLMPMRSDANAGFSRDAFLAA